MLATQSLQKQPIPSVLLRESRVPEHAPVDNALTHIDKILCRGGQWGRR